MISILFENWLININNQIKRQKWKILLFIDDCPAHGIIPNLDSVEVQFLPPNTTSKLQSLDQGIIHNFKTLYKKEVVNVVIEEIEEQGKVSISLLQAMRMIDKAWKNIN